MAKRSIQQVFESKYVPVPESGCWLWIGATRNGYGAVRRNNKIQYAHRLAFEAWRSPIPKGMNVCHTCDTPLCINPVHLFLGTHKDNVQDKMDKSRQARGSRQGLSKLTEQQVYEIKGRLESGETLKSIAAHYGVQFTTIHAIKAGATWGHL